MDKKIILKISVVVIISLAVGFFVGIEYKAYQIRKALSDVFDKPNQQVISTPEKSGQKKQDDYVWIKKNIGDTIELATIKFKVIKSEERQTISSKYGTPKVAKEGTKFVVIDLELTNIIDAPFYFSNYDGFAIFDDKERLFAEYDDTIGSIDNYLDGRKLSPDITERGVFVYEIPQDAESYSLTIGKSGTNEAYEVLLK